MRIGQLAQIVGVGKQTIRFYEGQGLLSPPKRQENGYRVYTDAHVEQLTFIKRCRALALSLVEIRELIRHQANPREPCTVVNEILDDHIARVRAQRVILDALEAQLVALRNNCNGGQQGEGCGILAGISGQG